MPTDAEVEAAASALAECSGIDGPRSYVEMLARAALEAAEKVRAAEAAKQSLGFSAEDKADLQRHGRT